MKRTIHFLTFFMYSLSTILLLRLIVSYIYELSYTFAVVQFQYSGVVTLSSVIYVTEIALTLMMSQSIKETTKTHKYSRTVGDGEQTPNKFTEQNVFDMSQNDCIQELERNMLKYSAFQNIDDVSLKYKGKAANQLARKQSNKYYMQHLSDEGSINQAEEEEERKEETLVGSVVVGTAPSQH